MNRRGLRSWRGALAGLGWALALIALPVIAGGEPDAARGAKGKPGNKRPNIIVITTDDHPVSQFAPRFMPTTFATIGAHPDTTLFTRSFALPPVCCPFRASMLTGQYPHNNGVFANLPGYSDLRKKKNVLPAWLQRQGYYTGVVGKYLNGTAATLARQGRQQTPGWDEWFVRTGESNSYFNVEFTDRRQNKRKRLFEDEIVEPPSARYFTDVVTNRALDFLDRRAAANARGPRQPFFLWLPHLAPHIGKDTKRGDQNSCSPHRYASATDELLAWAQENIASEAEVAKLPAFNEPDVSDKPGRIRKRKPIPAERLATVVQAFECSAAAIKGVDNSNAAIWSKLGELDMRRDTIIIFNSDNGFYYGEHRLVLKKGVAYEPGLRVPLMIKVPARYNANRESPPARSQAMTGQIDIAPTLLDYAGAPRQSCRAPGDCRRLDGRSLRAVLGDRAKPKIGRLNPNLMIDRTLLIERVKPCFWPGLRTQRAYYAIIPRNGTTDEPDCGGVQADEIYNLKRDPHEEQNLAERRKWQRIIKRRFRPMLTELRHCTGVKGRDERKVIRVRKDDRELVEALAPAKNGKKQSRNDKKKNGKDEKRPLPKKLKLPYCD